MHRLSGTPLYPHFNVGYAQTLRRGYKGYATLILCRIVSTYGIKVLAMVTITNINDANNDTNNTDNDTETNHNNTYW